MELRQLEYFYTVSTLENFTRAAHVLHVSQPSVTKAIQALEAELNLFLFDRTQKHITLTEAGKIFLLHTEKILQDVQTAKLSIEKFQTPNNGVVKLGIPPMVESYLFPNLFVKFQALNPNILLELKEFSDSVSINEKLNENLLDFAIMFLQQEKFFNDSLKLLESEFYLCLPINHKLAQEKIISFSDLKSEKFILQPNGTLQNSLTMKLAAEAGFVPNILLKTSQLQTIKELISGGVAISLLPKFVLTDAEKFQSLPLDSPVKLKIVLAWNKFREMSPLCTRFLKIFRGLLQSQEVKT